LSKNTEFAQITLAILLRTKSKESFNYKVEVMAKKHGSLAKAGKVVLHHPGQKGNEEG
jgi:hypothetical protein